MQIIIIIIIIIIIKVLFVSFSFLLYYCMPIWCRDSDNHLVRVESNNLFGNLSDSFTLSHTLDIMVDLESNQRNENNLNNENTSVLNNPLELSGIICNLLGVVHHHASFFQLMQIILILSLA